jgi:ATP phosphoribosyltransferase
MSITDQRFKDLVNAGRTLSAAEKRYVEKIISESQQVINRRQAIGLVVSSVKPRVSYLSEGVRLG